MHKPQSEESYMEIFQIGNMPLCGWRSIIKEQNLWFFYGLLQFYN